MKEKRSVRQECYFIFFFGCAGSSLQHRLFFSCIDWGSSLVALCRLMVVASLGAEGF